MQKYTPGKIQGSALLMAMTIVAGTAALIAAYYQSLLPRYRGTVHAAAWHEALHGAEAGVDHAVNFLNQNALSQSSQAVTDADAYDWTGWTKDSAYPLNGIRTLNSAISLGGNENVKVTSLTVDVYTRDASQSTPTYDPWFRVRSTARADLPGPTASLDKRDAVLRRLSLSAKNGTASDAHVSRTVEVIVKPVYRFSNAIITMQSLSLGNSANWLVDSFDSSNSALSDPGTAAGGVYPSSAAKKGVNGNIATLNTEPTGTLYGPLITGNGAVVDGSVSTVGGDNPSTAAHENVAGSGGMNQNRIYDNFDATFSSIAAPTWSSYLSAPAGNTNFITGSKASPAKYLLPGNLGAFAITVPSSGTGYVIIYVQGSLSIGNGNKAVIDVPPNVFATIYVTGNIDFGNGSVNSDSASSQVASHLTVFGLASSGSYSASGNGNDILVFYGPNYSISLNGTVTTVGAVVGSSFSISGGGNGGFHYDEALGKGGNIVGWQVASYFDDSRVDPQ